MNNLENLKFTAARLEAMIQNVDDKWHLSSNDVVALTVALQVVKERINNWNAMNAFVTRTSSPEYDTRN